MNLTDLKKRLDKAPASEVPAVVEQLRLAGLTSDDVGGNPELFRLLARRLISTGHPTRAFDLLREALSSHPADPELHYLQSLSLARGGNTTKATELATRLLQRRLPTSLRVETLSLLGRLWKDRFRESSRKTDDASHAAQQSLTYYRRAYELSRDSFPGINAASMCAIVGRTSESKRLATAVLKQAESKPKSSRHPDHWLLATLAEASLLLGRPDRAESWYQHAVRAAADRIGDVAAMRRNVLLLKKHLTVPDSLLRRFDLGRVVAFAGHLIDAPDRTGPPRFPPVPALEKSARLALGRELARLDARIGYSSAACGADLLFAEELLRRGGELHLVLPFALPDFLASSVDFGLESMRPWRRRFRAILAKATEVHYATTEPFLGDDVLFAFVNDFIQGLAVTRAAQIDADPEALVLLDPASPPVPGGTASFAERWQRLGRTAHVIDLAQLRNTVPLPPIENRKSQIANRPAPSDSSNRRSLKAMLFADVKNFSKLQEEQAPAFVATFQREVERVLKSSPRKPAFQNTWGDGLFFVFDEIHHAAEFSLRLLDQINRVDFASVGLPSDTTIRVGLHAGPVYAHSDRIIGRPNFFGSHVNRAARIEPVTTPGCVFASEQFAALLAVADEGSKRYRSEYVGVEELAKRFGKCPLYRVSRK